MICTGSDGSAPKPSRLVVQTATVIINIVLAPVLIFGWGTGRPLGVAGAALSTFIAIAIGIAWMALYFLPASSYLKFIRADMRPRIALWAEMLKIGLPAGAEFALISVYLVLVYVVSRPFGAAAQFTAPAVVFVSSSMFQAMGNTIPSLMTSIARIVLVALPVLLLARRPDFTLLWVWYISVASVILQMVMNLLLLRREFRLRL